MHWLMITRILDPADELAGFTVRWVNKLAARLDHLDVICQEQAASVVVPDNVRVHSMGKEAGMARAGQAWRLTQYLRQLTPQVDGVFCHMIPRYVWFAAPWTRLRSKPLLFWYTHRSARPELRIAHRLATHILTASPGSYPLPTPKLHVIGHGIEPDRFPPSEEEHDPPEIVLVARLSPVKRQDWLLRAAAQVQARGAVGPLRVILVGGAVVHEDAYYDRLHALAADLSPALSITFTGPLLQDRVAETLRHCAVAVNLSPPGHFDKAALEAMLTAKPTLVTNTDFLPLLGDDADTLYLPVDASDDALSARLAAILALAPAGRRALGRRLRDQAMAAHSLDGLMDRITALMQEVASHG